MTEQPVADVPWGDEGLRQALNSLPGPLRGISGEVRGEYQNLRRTWAEAGAVAAAPGLFEEAEPNGAAAVDSALAAVDAHAEALRGNPLWEQLQATREATRRMRRTTAALVGDTGWRKYVVPNGHWKRLWVDIGQNSTATYARLSGALADQLEREGNPATAGIVRDLRQLSHATAGYNKLLRQLPRDSLPTASPEAVDRELAALRHPFPGYGPDGGYAHAQGDVQLMRNEARRAAAGVTQRFKEWAGTEMGQRLVRASDPALRAFREAWQALPAPDRQGSFRDAARLYGRLAARAHEVREKAREANKRHPGRYSARDIAALDAFADASYAHAARLARTRPPGNLPGAAPYESPQAAQAGNIRLAELLVAWQKSDMGRKLIGAERRHPLVDELGAAWKRQDPFPAKKPHTYDQWTAAGKAGDVADAAKRLLDRAERAQAQTPGRFAKADMDKLRAFANGARVHASKLAEAHPPKSVLPKNPAFKRVPVPVAQRAPQAPAPVMPAPVRRTPSARV
ncbi:hypothetical protein FM076_33050 [Streptomyces albus subsp. chlorinus]|uniref:hypothetical protein n=1 Tax=Streptomyces albus TaxID=1888 RepID=UPI00156EC0B8|nr:hypothetical protein [Streptomyces albus]NSC25716.1 hypothetical protein [Streptomyces albus subsp. chlorinus]